MYICPYTMCTLLNRTTLNKLCCYRVLQIVHSQRHFEAKRCLSTSSQLNRNEKCRSFITVIYNGSPRLTPYLFMPKSDELPCYLDVWVTVFNTDVWWWYCWVCFNVYSIIHGESGEILTLLWRSTWSRACLSLVLRCAGATPPKWQSSTSHAICQTLWPGMSHFATIFASFFHPAKPTILYLKFNRFQYFV